MKRRSRFLIGFITAAITFATLMAFAKIKGFEKFGTKPKNVAVITVEKKTPRDTCLQELLMIRIRTSSGIFV